MGFETWLNRANWPHNCGSQKQLSVRVHLMTGRLSVTASIILFNSTLLLCLLGQQKYDKVYIIIFDCVQIPLLAFLIWVLKLKSTKIISGDFHPKTPKMLLHASSFGKSNAADNLHTIPKMQWSSNHIGCSHQTLGSHYRNSLSSNCSKTFAIIITRL